MQLCGDTAEFLVSEGCCIHTDVYGKGSFRKSGNEIEISIDEAADDRKPGHQIIRNLPDTRELQIQIATNGRVLEDIIIRLVDIRGESVFTTRTDSSGYASVLAPKNPEASALRLEISYFGFETYTIPFGNLSGKEVTVNLPTYKILKADCVYFQLDTSGRLLRGIYYEPETATTAGCKKSTLASGKRAFKRTKSSQHFLAHRHEARVYILSGNQ